MRLLAGIMVKHGERRWLEPAEATKEPTLVKVCETDTDIKNFLTGFERVARAYKWSEDMWVLKLIPLLTGRCMAAYANMDPEMARDYEEVKQAILHRFDINKET